MKLVILQGKIPVHSVDVEARSWTLGRAPDNDVVLRDADVSGHHALLYWNEGELWIQDLGSTNGTYVDGSRIGQRAIGLEQTVRLGGFQLRLEPTEALPVGYVLRALSSPVGRGVQPGFSLPEHPDVVLFEEDASVYLDAGDERREVELGQPFELDGERYVLEGTRLVAPTVPQDGMFPYQLKVDLGAPFAALSATALQPVEYRAAARVSLLYVLGSAAGEWVDNDEVGRGVWGRDWIRQGANNLNVLVHRVRKSAESRGYDRRFIERRPSGMRLALQSASVG